MTTRRIPATGYYVYILFREDGETPFYVGKGGLDRWLLHERRARKNASHKDRVILEMQRRDIVVPKRKIAEGLTHKAACQLEIDTIAKIGCWPDGPLTNKTRGGEGCPLPPDALQKRNAAIKRAWDNPERRRVHAEMVKKIWTEEMRREFAKRQSERCSSPEMRAVKKHVSLDAWAKGGSARRLAIKNRVQSPESKKKHSDGLRRAWSDPATREKMTKGRLNPEVMARASIKQRKLLSTPQARERCRAAGKKGAASRWGRRRHIDGQGEFHFLEHTAAP